MKHRVACLLLTATAVVMLLAACGSRLTRGEPPFVSIQSIETTPEGLALRLRVRNVNELPIPLGAMRFSLNLESTELVRFDGPRSGSVIANGAETLSFELDPTEAGLGLLASLAAGEVANLAYAIEGEIRTPDGEGLRFEGEGRIYPVPGRNGQFR